MLPRLQDYVEDLANSKRRKLGKRVVEVAAIIGSAETPDLFRHDWTPVPNEELSSQKHFKDIFDWVAEKDPEETDYGWIHLYMIRLDGDGHGDGDIAYFVGADGNHRIAALKILGRQRVTAEVVEILTQTDAGNLDQSPNNDD